MKTKKLLSLILLGMLCSIGNVWGTDYTIYQATSSGKNTSNVKETEVSVTFNSMKAYSNSAVTTVANTTYGIEAGLKAPRFGGGSNGNNIIVTISESYIATITAYVQVNTASQTMYIRQTTESGTALTTVSCASTNTVYEVKASNLAAGTYYIKSSSDKVGLIKLMVTVQAAAAQAPTFSPATGSSIASESNVDITSANATTVYYKWTTSSDSPAEGWSSTSADANGKITVTAPAYDSETPANNTRYLHAYGEKSSTAGTAGYAQYTITAPDTEAPTLSSTSPTNSATDVAVSGNIVLTFNENIVCTTNATLTPFGGDPIALTPSVSGTTVTYAYENLDYNLAHTFNLAANSVADGSGNQYASAINFSFTTEQETCATPTFTVYGNKVVQISCATDGATIYYGGSDVKTGTKTEYTGLFIPASNGTIYAYATKSGTNDSELGSKSITLPVVGDVVGELLMTLQPDAKPSGDATYASGYSKANYTLTIASEGSIKNSPMANYPNNFKISAGKDITITPPSNVTIQSIKIIGANNNSTTDTKNVQVGSGFSIDGSAALMPKNVFVDDEQVMSEVVVKPNSASEGATVVFKLEKESRIYIKVYGTTSATTESITPSKTYTTYIPTHNLDFTSASSLTAFIATAANSSNVTLTSVDKVPAGTPIVVKAAATGSPITVNVTTTTDDVSSNLLKCGDGTTNVGGTKKYDYILSDGLFYRADEGTVAVGKAYLHLDSAPAAGAPSILRIEDEENNATTIQNIDDNVKVVKFVENGQLLIKRDGVVYDTMGRIIR